MTDWKPITTAPFDKTILVTNGTEIFTTSLEKIGNYVFLNSIGFGGHDTECYFEYKELSHWAEMPELPK